MNMFVHDVASYEHNGILKSSNDQQMVPIKPRHLRQFEAARRGRESLSKHVFQRSTSRPDVVLLAWEGKRC